MRPENNVGLLNDYYHTQLLWLYLIYKTAGLERIAHYRGSTVCDAEKDYVSCRDLHYSDVVSFTCGNFFIQMYGKVCSLRFLPFGEFVSEVCCTMDSHDSGHRHT